MPSEHFYSHEVLRKKPFVFSWWRYLWIYRYYISVSQTLLASILQNTKCERYEQKRAVLI